MKNDAWIPSESPRVHRVQWRGIRLEFHEKYRRLLGIEFLTRPGELREDASTDHPLVELIERRVLGHVEVPWEKLKMEPLPEFTRRALVETARVRSGNTLAYGEIARRAGSPGGARAAGQALRRNPFPLLIPCHRIIRSNGEPGGYGGESDSSLKKRLLRFEKRHATSEPENHPPRDKRSSDSKCYPVDFTPLTDIALESLDL